MRIDRKFERRGPLYLPRYDVDYPKPGKRFERYKDRFRSAMFLKAHTFAAGSASITTPSVDTTGANFIVVVATYYTPGGPPSVSDLVSGNSNSYTGLTIYSNPTAPGLSVQIFYSTPLHTGPGHTFTSTLPNTAYDTLLVQAWSGMATSSVFQQGTDSGGFGVGFNPSLTQPGPITPKGLSLVVSGVAVDANTGVSIDSGFSISDQAIYNAGTNYGGAFAYLLQQSGSAINPTWTVTSTTNNSAVAAIAAFTGASQPVAGAQGMWGGLVESRSGSMHEEG